MNIHMEEGTMKRPRLNQQARSLPSRHTLALACGTLVASLWWSQSHAQPQAQPEIEVRLPGNELPSDQPTAVPRTGTWIEPRVTTGVTLTNNGPLVPNDPPSEQILEVTPGIRVVLNGPRAKGFLDYSLSALYHAQGTSGDNFRNALNADMTFEAVDNRLFIDASGIISDEVISAYGTQSFGRVDANRSETKSFRVSPYVRGMLGSMAEYELRYSLETLQTDTIFRSDITAQDLALSLRSDISGRRFGWLADASVQEADYSLDRRTRSNLVRGGLLYAASPQLLLTLLAGRESNDIITPTRESYSTTGLNLDWRPSNRTRLQVGVERRYFGTGHNVSLEHRSGRTVWRFVDARDVADSPLDAQTASLGSVYSLLDNLYATQEPDPVRRAQLVEAELLRLGLPANANGLQGVLASTATLDRAQQLSVALVGMRDVVTVALTRSSSRRLGTGLNVGDDLDNGNVIRQQAWSVNYSHRLTPITTYNAGVTWQKYDGLVAGETNRLTSIALGMTTRISLRTSATLQLLRALYDRAGGSYRETAVSALITHRF